MTECCQINDAKSQVHVQELEEAIRQKRAELINLLRSAQRKEVSDYQFSGHAGNKIGLSELFGTKTDLIVIHNMGQRCPSCTMWADGFNGIVDHLQDRAGFVVISNDDVETQKKFKATRGWRFPMVSAKDTSFFEDMGFTFPQGSAASKDWGQFAPGISTFVREPNGKIFRVASRPFGPGDDFCATWHIFDLLEQGSNGWEAKFRYTG
jgi:predicted dithiol-disulfide oxidoreductase (DUF899 family)